ncbi:hypothetical protein ABIA33_005761 [Streptacidiphilus sp. MAP12-16]|uniref:hypothetical protein n=1 Tax=Streptacidiphilus sp. MAP12-16 TaxID=3156300 RepID=UPI0035137A58
MASDANGALPDEEQPPARGAGARHAAPRRTVRGRMQLPVGRVLALTAMPTALLMGSIAPKFAFAADTRAVPVSSGTSAAAAQGSDCTKTSATPTASTSSGTGKTGTAKSGTSKAGSAKAGSATSGTVAAPRSVGSPPAASTPASSSPGNGGASSSAPAPTASSAPTTPAPTTSPTPTNPLQGVLNGLGGLLGIDAATASPTPTASPTASASASATPAAHRAAALAVPAAATTAPKPSTTKAPSATPTPSASSSASPSATPSPTATAKTPTPTASSTSPAAAANKTCNISHLAAPLDTSVTPGEMPADPWTLKTSRLELINTEFHGVVTVHTAGGDVRVLKFTAEQVNIDNLDMSVKQNGQRLHVQGGPSTRSTMRGGTVTMYVTSLSGTLAAAEGIPLAWLNVNLTLTPDTLPQWLYNLIGAVPIPLTLVFNDATAVQTGQFGGNLTIPGMHLYYTPLA